MNTTKVFTGIANQNSHLQEFNILRVGSVSMFNSYWAPTMELIFNDPASYETREQMAARLKKGEDFFLMWDVAGKRPAGIEHIQVLPDSGLMFIPCTGVLPEYRNLGIGSAMTQRISGFMRQKYGATHTVVEIEDPQRLHSSDYTAEELSEALAFANRRLNYWRRQNCIIIDDEQKSPGQKLAYICPSMDDDQKILDGYHMAVRLDEPALRGKIMTTDGAVSKAFARKTYLNLSRIQYGPEMNEAQLRGRYPAIDEYLRNIDAIKADTLPIHTSPFTVKTSPTAKFTLSMNKPPVAFMTAANSSRRLPKAGCE